MILHSEAISLGAFYVTLKELVVILIIQQNAEILKKFFDQAGHGFSIGIAASENTNIQHTHLFSLSTAFTFP